MTRSMSKAPTIVLLIMGVSTVAASSIRPHQRPSGGASAANSQSYTPMAAQSDINAIQDLLSDPGWGELPRVERLAQLAYSLRLFGRYEKAIAACELFLSEFGPGHAYAGQVAMRRAESLAPMAIDSYAILHTPAGPELEANWGVKDKPSTARLQAAEQAYRFVAEIATDKELRASALFMRGWVFRAAGDWAKSTQAWDLCAAEAPGTLQARQALWLAAENLELTGDFSQAHDRLLRFVQSYPQDGAAPAARRKAASLLAASRRGPEWERDPVVSYQHELEAEPRDGRPAFEVYREGLAWLVARHADDAALELARWAKDAPGWSGEQRAEACVDLANRALVGDRANDRNRIQEAAEALHSAASLARPEDPQRIPYVLRESELRRRLDQSDEALRLLDGLMVSQSLPLYQERFDAERIRVLTACGKTRDAATELDRFRQSHPGSPESAILEKLVIGR